MKVLYVGDPHATPDALEEMGRLVDLIIETAKRLDAPYVIFLGDQYHTHSIINLAVMAFWDHSFKRMKEANLQVLALVGNHDKSGVKGQVENAMMLHDEVVVISSPVAFGKILLVPYVGDTERFVQICREYPDTNLVVCHQTFAGSHFENGFMTPDGVEPNLIPQEQVISGHIHAPQRVGKVWYPGAPRWRSVTDANTDRAIWVVEHDQAGLVVGATPVDTSVACTPIYALSDSPTEPVQMPTGSCKVVVDVYGPADYVAKRKRELEVDGVRVRTFPESEKIVKVKESDGLPTALQKFLGEYSAKNKTSPEVLWQMAKERISWLKLG